MPRRLTAGFALTALSLLLVGCREPSAGVTLRNDTGSYIRFYGACTDADAADLNPGETSNMLYLGEKCTLDDGDGLKGILGCITLRTEHTVVTRKMLDGRSCS